MKCAICDEEIGIDGMDICIFCQSQRNYLYADVLDEGPNVSRMPRTNGAIVWVAYSFFAYAAVGLYFAVRYLVPRVLNLLVELKLRGIL